MGVFICGSMIQTIILINNENYGFASWQGTLLAIAAAAVSYIAVVYGAMSLPYGQFAVFALHVGAYFAYLVPIWVNSPRVSHERVWSDFQNTGGWSNLGLAVLVGQLTGISEQVGIDTVSFLQACIVRLV